MIVWPENFPIIAGAQEGGLTFPGGTVGTAEEEPAAPDLTSWLGREFFNPFTGRYGVLRWASTAPRRYRNDQGLLVQDPGGKQVKGYFDLVDPGGGRTRIRQGDTILDTATFRVLSIGTDPKTQRTGISAAKQATQDDLERWGLAQAGDGSAAADRASAEAIAAAQRELDLELALLQEENALKRQKLSTAGSLAERAMEVQRQIREYIAQTTGVDPIAGAIAEQGGLQRGGLTPAQAARQTNIGLANRPIPQVDENADLDQVIAQLRSYGSQPAVTPGFRFGGDIEMQHGGDDVFRANLGTTKRAILTGERNMDGDEEVVVLDAANPGRTEVIPLLAGAQTGGTFDYDPNTIRQAFAPIYGQLGFRGIPSFLPRSDVGFSIGATSATEGEYGGGGVLRKLGYQPRLIRDTSSGKVYYRDPVGTLRHITSPEMFGQAGFRWQDVLSVNPDELAGLGTIGEQLYGPPPVVEGGVRAGTPRSQPLITPEAAGSIPLPDISQIAGIWRFLTPQTRQVVASTYARSGLGAGESFNPVENAIRAIEEAARFFTPRGTATRATATRFA